MTEQWQEEDAKASYAEAIAEIGRRVKAGEEPMPTTGYFERSGAIKKEVVIGDCRLILGDCREVLASLGPVDAIITDPPYGCDWPYASHRDDFEGWKLLVDWYIATSAKICRGNYIICTSKIEGEQYIWNKWPPVWRVCWYKGATTTRCAIGWKDWEPIFVYGNRHVGPFHDFMELPPQRVGEIDHPAPKPEAWARWLVKRLSRSEDMVVDPFMGSGTTGVACAKANRRFTGIEIEPRYFDIACRRIEEATRQGDLIRDVYDKPKQLAGW